MQETLTDISNNVITFVTTKHERYMETNIVKIGNSRGVVIPSAVLKALDMTEHSTVNMTIEKNTITIKKIPTRAGWEAAAQQMHDVGDDKLLMPEVFEDEYFNDWTW